MARVEYNFDPFDAVGVSTEGLPTSAVKEAISEIGDFVYSKIIEKTADQESAVTGESFPKLSASYAKKKLSEAGNTLANLALSGDMMESLKVINRGSTITVTVGANQQAKADGHNNHSGDSRIPERKFIPSADLGETFSEEILSGVSEIVTRYVEDNKPVEPDTLNGIVDAGLKVKLKKIVEDIF